MLENVSVCDKICSQTKYGGNIVKERILRRQGKLSLLELYLVYYAVLEMHRRFRRRMKLQ